MILYISIGLGLLLSCCIIIIAPGFKTAYDDRDLPEDKKRGASIFPGIPFMPILVGVVAYFSNRYVSTWIAIGILALNAAFAAWALVYGVYWLIKWRKSPNQIAAATLAGAAELNVRCHTMGVGDELALSGERVPLGAISSGLIGLSSGLKLCYQQADEATMLEVVLGGGELRESRG